MPELRRFTDFATLTPAALASVTASATRLRVPARRWLLRPGRALSGRFYLLEGRVQLIEQGRTVIVGAGSARARAVLYPGASAVGTLATSSFLRVTSLAAAQQAEVQPDAPPGVPDLLGEDSWQQRFLSSPLMRGLDPLIWQRVLRAMRRCSFAAGDRVVRAGAGADCCYVLCSGSAEIRAADGRRLAEVSPGSLFGEDALISGSRRNADVVMRVGGSAMALEAERFRAWLLDEVVQPVDHMGTGIPIDIGGGCGVPIAPAALRRAAAALSAQAMYVITGGSDAERRLAAFLLAEQGIAARPLSEPGLRPVPCGCAPRS